MKIEDLENFFEKSKDEKYIAVVIHRDNFLKDQVVINEKENFDKELEYYKNTYDNDLQHRHVRGISITKFVSGSNFEEIETNLASKGGETV